MEIPTWLGWVLVIAINLGLTVVFTIVRQRTRR